MKGRIRNLLMILTLISLLAVTSSAFGLPFTYTTNSGDSGPGAGITYTLDIVPSTGQNYSATFTMSNFSDTSPEWYAGWFLFKFGGSTPATIGAPRGPGIWRLSDPEVMVLGGGGNYQKLEPGGGFSGFYVTSLAKGGVPDNPPKGILLTGSSSTATLTFNFQLPDGDSVRTDSIPFKVGYYDPPSGDEKYIVINKLSEDMAVVPEPSTLLLLGSGLMGLGLWGRRKFKGRN